jgi:GNAT superfamily N-acetyltransferase
MPLSGERAVSLRIVPASAADVAFAHDLTRDNMSRDYAAAGLAWDPALIPHTWPETENYLLVEGDTRIGIVRLRVSSRECHLGDLQILPAHRNRGAGTFALKFVEDLARQRGATRLRLRVFSKSPAVRLYRRAGFVDIDEQGAKLQLEKILADS